MKSQKMSTYPLDRNWIHTLLQYISGWKKRAIMLSYQNNGSSFYYKTRSLHFNEVSNLKNRIERQRTYKYKTEGCSEHNHSFILYLNLVTGSFIMTNLSSKERGECLRSTSTTFSCSHLVSIEDFQWNSKKKQ